MEIYMVISTDAEKALNKTQCPFRIWSLSKEATELNFLNLIKGVSNHRPADIILNHEALTSFPWGWEQVKLVHA